jgi:hypothetical protein
LIMEWQVKRFPIVIKSLKQAVTSCLHRLGVVVQFNVYL